MTSLLLTSLVCMCVGATLGYVVGYAFGESKAKDFVQELMEEN